MTKGTVLFLAYHFPPNITSVAGVRGGNIALELARNGWQVKVITPACDILLKIDPVGQPVPEHPNLEIIETGHDLPELAHWWLKERSGFLPKFTGKLGRGFFQLFDFDQSIGWVRHVKQAAARFKPDDIQVVLASGSPYISFKTAARIAHKLHCPFVMDYRDLWTLDPHNTVHNPLIIRREKKLLAKTAAAVTVADGMGEILKGLCPSLKTLTVTNGYSPELFHDIPAATFDEPAFVYTGRFMPPLSTPDPLMKTLALLDHLAPQKCFKLHYYGQQNELVRQAAEAAQISKRVICHGTVSRQESLAAIKGAKGAIVITSNNQQADIAERGILTGKIFEPIGLGTPVICLTPEESEARHLIETTHTGGAFWAGDTEGIANYMARLLLGPTSPGDGTSYSWPVLGKKYSDLLESIVKP